MKRAWSGFTLVELIVVIATIGILATITVIGLTRYQADTRDARRASSVGVITEALEKYYDQNGEYPSCQDVMAAASVVTSETLKGVSPSAIQAPQAPSNQTNSIECGSTLTVNGEDFFEYVGDGSSSCTGNQSCLSYTLRYKEEGNGTIKSVESRRNTSIATSGAATISIAETDFDNITVQWTEVPNATTYVVQRSSSAAFTSPTEVPATSGQLSQVMGGLNTASTYYFRVRPNANATEGSWSNVVSASTQSIAKPVCTATANSNSQITTNWNSVSNATSYNFRYSTSPSMSGASTTNGLSSGTLSRVLTGLSTGVTYYFQVMAVNSTFNSGWSITCSATTFVPAPSSISATTNSATQITVTWSSVSVAETYKLQYSSTSNFSSSVTTIDGLTSTTRVLTGLQQGLTHYFRVYALVGTAESVASPTASATTTVNAPGAPGMAASQPGAVRSCANGYWVQYPAQCPNNYYATGWVTSASCPSGTYAVYNIYGRYNSPSTAYYSGATTASQWFLVSARSGYYTLWAGQYYCQGPSTNSGWGPWSGEVRT